MTQGRYTPGPWAWFGNAGSNSVYLATVHSGRRFVMDFTRWGFRGAQPRFQHERGIMTDAKDLLQFEVGDQSIVGIEVAKKDTSVYRLDVRGIDNADARLIAAAPEMLEALQGFVAKIDPAVLVENDLSMSALADELRAALSVIAKATGGDHA